MVHPVCIIENLRTTSHTNKTYPEPMQVSHKLLPSLRVPSGTSFSPRTSGDFSCTRSITYGSKLNKDFYTYTNNPDSITAKKVQLLNLIISSYPKINEHIVEPAVSPKYFFFHLNPLKTVCTNNLKEQLKISLRFTWNIAIKPLCPNY